MTARPPSVPPEGVVPAFDAGWNAAEVGLSRETVAVIAAPDAHGWALIGYDTCKLAERRSAEATLSTSDRAQAVASESDPS